LVAGFTKKYGVHILVWYELHTDIHEAIAREKQIKGWNRASKIKLIEKNNSGWNDLYERLLGNITLPESHGSSSLASCANARDARQGRQDITHLAISLIQKRVRDAFPLINIEMIGVPKDLDGARALAAQDKVMGGVAGGCDALWPP
jgi:hypothetical protein